MSKALGALVMPARMQRVKVRDAVLVKQRDEVLVATKHGEPNAAIAMAASTLTYPRA
jgi:hypothetical protein